MLEAAQKVPYSNFPEVLIDTGGSKNAKDEELAHRVAALLLQKFPSRDPDSMGWIVMIQSPWCVIQGFVARQIRMSDHVTPEAILECILIEMGQQSSDLCQEKEWKVI